MALEAIDIAFSYSPRFSIGGASLRAGRGEWVSLIGPNGSGKTTLLKILCGLLRPSSGQVLLDDRRIDLYPAAQRARRLAYVPQNYQPTFDYTVEQSVLLGRMPYHGIAGGFESAEDIAAADRAIRLMELDGLRSVPITELSGGELQRATIARALAQRTGTIVLDEPTSHLDIAHQQSVLGTIREEAERDGLTVIATIHDLNLASIFSDSIAVIHEGRLLRHDSPANVLTPELLREVFDVEMDVQEKIFGAAPAVRYRYNRRGARDVA